MSDFKILYRLKTTTFIPDSTKQSNTFAADQMEADRLLALSISNEDDPGLDQETTSNLDSLLSNHGNRDLDESELDLWENDRDLGSPSRRRLNSQVSQSALWDALDENGESSKRSLSCSNDENEF